VVWTQGLTRTRQAVLPLEPLGQPVFISIYNNILKLFSEDYQGEIIFIIFANAFLLHLLFWTKAVIGEFYYI
jgi:hypothetical protein